MQTACCYRGAVFQAAEDNELRGRVSGAEIPIYAADIPEAQIPERKDVIVTALENIDVLPERPRMQPITGGFTDQLGTAIHFSQGGTMGDGLPLVFYIDRASLPPLTEIRYEIDFFDAHPGAVAHIDTLGDGEIHFNGKVWGTTHDGTPSTYGRENVELSASSNTYADESEYMVYGESEVDISNAVTNIATVVMEDAPGAIGLKDILTLLSQRGDERINEAFGPGLPRGGFRGNRQLTRAFPDPDDRVGAMASIASRLLPDNAPTHSVVAIDGDQLRNIKKDTLSFEYSDIKAAAVDGRLVSPESVPPEVLGQ